MAMTDLAKGASNVFRLRTTAPSDEEFGYYVHRIPFMIEIRCRGTMGRLNYRWLEADVK